MKALALCLTLAAVIYIHRRRPRHPLSNWVRDFYDEALLR